MKPVKLLVAPRVCVCVIVPCVIQGDFIARTRRRKGGRRDGNDVVAHRFRSGRFGKTISGREYRRRFLPIIRARVAAAFFRDRPRTGGFPTSRNPVS